MLRAIACGETELAAKIDEFQFFLEKEWSDGFPVVTPTEAGNAAGIALAPHPISNLTREQMRAVTLPFADQLVRQLTA